MAKARKDGGEEAMDGNPSGKGFEQALERLEEIVERMEQGDLALEDAMALFEEGVKLGSACQKRLDEAERRITVLLESADGTLQEQAFDADAAARAEAPAARPPASPSRPAAPKPKPAPGRQPLFDRGTGPGDIPF